MNIKKKILLKYFILFSILCIFFTEICPIVPYVGDDWYFVGSMRQPVPYTNIFNPSKIFPEILQPICGYLGAYLIYPITHDYVGSIAISAAIIVSSFIVLLSYMFYKVLKNRLDFSFKNATVYEMLFLLLFFIVFKKEGSASFYGFWSINFTCYFNYILPGILNACIVLYMMSFKDFQKKFIDSSHYYKGIFAICIYFAIFSSIQLNIIIASYVFIQFLKIMLSNIHDKSKLIDRTKNVLKESWVYLGVLLVWLVAVIYDFTGMRGKMLSSSNWLTLKNFNATFGSLISTYKFFYKPLLAIMVVAIFLLVLYSIKQKRRNSYKYFLESIALFAINVLYLILLYMNAGSGYAARVDATWGILFYLLLFVMLVLIMCNKLMKWSNILIPILFIIFFLVSINLNYPYQQSIYDATEAKQIDNYIINQIVKADKEGHSFVKVKVPKNDENGSNWPQPYNMALWLQNTLYSHRIIRTRMKIEFIPDKKVFKKLHKKNFNSEYYVDFERSKYLK